MSVEAISLALNHSNATGTAKLVLVGIANHDGDGGSWPSIGTLARYANVDASNVRKALRRLEQLGEVRVHINEGGTAATPHHLRPNFYEFLVECPETCDATRWHRRIDPQALARGGGATARGPLAEAPAETSTNHPTTQSRHLSLVSERVRGA